MSSSRAQGLNSFVYQSIGYSQNGRKRCQRPSWVETYRLDDNHVEGPVKSVGLDPHQLSCSWGFINWTPAFDSQTFIRPTNLCWYFTRGYKGEQRITKGSWSLDAEWSLLFSLFSVHVAQAPWNTVASTLSNNAFICRPFSCVTQPVKYCSTKRICARLTYLLGCTIGATGDNKICYKIRLHSAWFRASDDV